jgi:hypothetical protein
LSPRGGGKDDAGGGKPQKLPSCDHAHLQIFRSRKPQNLQILNLQIQ